MSSRSRSNGRILSAAIEKDDGKIVRIGHIHEDVVRLAYKRWAPVYDHTFGAVSDLARRSAVRYMNTRQGSTLEVGVGTGLALGDYAPHLEITGIDLSPEMLEKARLRVEEKGLTNIKAILEMDAGDLKFADNSFDTTVAMFLITVVPDPEKVMHELARVTKPGGEVLLVNHFSTEEGVRGWVERRMAPFAELIGWRPVFDVSRVMGSNELELTGSEPLKPWGIFTMMHFRKKG